MKKFLLAISITASTVTIAKSQTTQYLDPGNIRALIGTAGHLWWDTATGGSQCEYPKASGKHVGFNANLWIGGYDPQGQLRVAANTFRQAGNDYWQGPLNATGTSSAASQSAWDRVWKISRTQLDTFFSTTTHTLANTPDAVLRWPARGNTYATGATGSPLTALIGATTDFAPFIDVNSDGVYNALQGDYPKLLGDQMVWQMYNDGGGTKTQTSTAAFPLQISLIAWAYQRGTIADNVQFYEYVITNRGGQIDSAVTSVFADMDLGFAIDDYMGFDSAHRMGYIYNADTLDGTSTGQSGTYGAQIPVAGIALLRTAGDVFVPGGRVPTGAFTYFNNGSGPGSIQDPQTGIQFYRYMTGRNRSGDPFRRDFTGQQGVQTNGLGSGPVTKIIFDGDPAVSGTWSECFSGNAPGDRRYVLSSSPFTFPAGETRTVAFGLVVSPNAGGCPATTLGGIRQTADTAFVLYDNPPPYSPTPVASVGATVSGARFKLFPNPANQELSLKLETVTPNTRVEVFDAAGRRSNIVVVRTSNGFSLQTAPLPPGVYAIRLVESNGSSTTATFVKQ